MTLHLKHIVRTQDSGARLARCFKQERDVETVSILHDGADFRYFLTPSLLSTLVTSVHDDRDLPLRLSPFSRLSVLLREKCSADLMTFAESQN